MSPTACLIQIQISEPRCSLAKGSFKNFQNQSPQNELCSLFLDLESAFQSFRWVLISSLFSPAWYWTWRAPDDIFYVWNLLSEKLMTFIRNKYIPSNFFHLPQNSYTSRWLQLMISLVNCGAFVKRFGRPMLPGMHFYTVLILGKFETLKFWDALYIDQESSFCFNSVFLLPYNIIVTCITSSLKYFSSHQGRQLFVLIGLDNISV